MKRGKRINFEFQLPEPIIQEIQSHLNGKQAARTSIISKSWFKAWLTIPHLDFDARYFQTPGNRDSESESTADRIFENFVNKTMQRYNELNIKITKFTLWMRVSNPDLVSLANDLIVKVLRMGVTDLKLDFFLRDVLFESHQETYVLPHEVFEADLVTRLSVSGCKIDFPCDRKVGCSRVELLSLSQVCIRDDVVSDIVSRCTLIKDLHLFQCKSFVDGRRSTKIVKLRSPLIEGNVGSNVDRPIKGVSEFHKLKSLMLRKVNVGREFFSDFNLKFPCLEDLSIHYCRGYKEEIQISSRSLKRISLWKMITKLVKFDIPNISKLTFIGNCFPRLQFTSDLKECESDILVAFDRDNTEASWFRELKRFLTELTPSHISLKLGIFGEVHFDHVGGIDGLFRPMLENLIITVNFESSEYSALLNGIFWSCRPKVVTLSECLRKFSLEKPHNDLLEFLSNRVIQQVNQNCGTPNQNVIALQGLEDVDVEYFEEALTNLRKSPPFSPAPIPASTDLRWYKVCFRLKWEQPDGAREKP